MNQNIFDPGKIFTVFNTRIHRCTNIKGFFCLEFLPLILLNNVHIYRVQGHIFFLFNKHNIVN